MANVQLVDPMCNIEISKEKLVQDENTIRRGWGSEEG